MAQTEHRGGTGRREVLRGALAGAAGLVAGTVAAAGPADAADGDPLLLGRDNACGGVTGIVSSGGFFYVDARQGQVNAIEGGYYDLYGTPGRYNGNGVFGISYNPSGDGVFGTHNNDGNGVHGSAFSDVSSGVYGENAGRGFGVAGRAANGIGVLADSTNGFALDVHGLARFSRCGIAVVQGSSTKPRAAVTVGGFYLNGYNLDLILTTAQTHVAGVWVTDAVPNLVKNNFTIHLNQAVKVPYKIAFMIVQAPQ